MIKLGDFPPPKRRGLLLHGILIVALALLTITAFFYLTTTEPGAAFPALLFAALLSLAPIPVLGYRAYALSRANYELNRNSLVLRWGLRVEEIPLNDIEWMRMAADLTRPLRLPALRTTGSVLGVRRHPDLGTVEFIASDPRSLVLVATARRVFAISPEKPAGLLQSFARATELGSLLPAVGKSVYPSFVIAEAWAHPMARFTWLNAIVINLGLFIWTSTLIPGLSGIVFGPGAPGTAPAVLPSSQLLLLPAASLVLAAAGWLVGLYLFRWERERPLALIVWLSSALTSALFAVAVLFTLNSAV